MSEKNFKACPLPWIQVSILPDGRVRLCCHSNTSNINKSEKLKSYYIQTDSLREILSSSWLRDIRKQFANGAIPESCSFCFCQESHHSDNPVDHYRMNFGNPEEGMFEGGPKVRLLDLSLTRICNLQCLMCSPKFSTGLESLYQKTMLGEQICHDPFDLGFIETEDFHLLTKDLNAILFQGGEPFLSSLHIPILENLIDRGLSSRISLNYITNGTIPLDSRVLELWKKFANVQLEVSLDDVESRAEYIRHPLKWDKFKANFQELSDLSESGEIKLDTVLTYQALNTFAIPRVFKFLQNFKCVSRVPLVNILEHPRFLSYRWLPLKHRQKARKQLDTLLNSEELTEREVKRISFLKKKLLEERPSDSSECKSDFVVHIKRTNALRGSQGENISNILDYIS